VTVSRRALGTAAFSVLLLAATVAVLLATRPTPSNHPAHWSDDDAVRVACWLLAVVCTAWLATTVLAYAAAIARADVGAAWRAARFAPPIVRRTLRTALAGALAVAPITSDSLPRPRPPVRLHAGADGRLAPRRARVASTSTTPPTTAAPPTTTTTTTTPAPPPTTVAPVTPARPARPRRGMPDTTARVHLVRPGDNLWSIARTEVARASGHADPSDHAVAPYWQRVIAANRATLRSGDPSLIFPGEIVALPNP
jgi:hypothetical protein